MFCPHPFVALNDETVQVIEIRPRCDRSLDLLAAVVGFTSSPRLCSPSYLPFNKHLTSDFSNTGRLAPQASAEISDRFEATSSVGAIRSIPISHHTVFK